MKTEESERISFFLSYIDPENPDPHPPEIPPEDRWAIVRLSESIDFTLPNIVKISKATDFRSSLLAVYADSNSQLKIWGLIDQGNQFHEFVNHDTTEGPERPGLFQASVLGIGHLVVFQDYERIAELKVNHLSEPQMDIITNGVIHDKLEAGFVRTIQHVQEVIDPEVFEERDHWRTTIEHEWLSVVTRLLLRVQNLGHGGSFVIVPNGNIQNLNIKYKIDYERIPESLRRSLVYSIMTTKASDDIYLSTQHLRKSKMQTSLYLDESVSAERRNQTKKEIDSAIWFVSLLTRVDGLVLLTPDLGVNGFGVEITSSEQPPNVYLAKSTNPVENDLQLVDYNHFGTRHRSMMRYCWENPDAIGFVISQDGDVRTISQIKGKLLIWDNLRLHFEMQSLRGIRGTRSNNT